MKKRYTSKSEVKYYNSRGKCCNNDQVKKIMDVEKSETKSQADKQTAYDELGSQVSLIHVYFKELEAVKYSKQENYGIMDLIGKLLYQYCMFIRRY